MSNFGAKCALWCISAWIEKHLILTNMKKEYLEPEVRIAQIGFEVNFLASGITLGGLGGEDLDDPDDPFDPWN